MPFTAREDRRARRAPMLARAEMERIAARLAVLGHGAGATRLGIGEGLLRLDVVGGVKGLGFPNLEAYCREALGRSGRFGSDVRALARRLSILPELRAALITGRLNASMVELVARVATPLDEAEWVERAATMNVRAMRAELMRRRLEVMDDEAPERTTIAMTVPRDEAWAFERAKMMVEAVGGVRGDEAIEAMLAEGLTEILARVPDFDLPWNLTAAAQDEIVEARRVRAEQRAEREAQESSAARFVGAPHHVAVGSGGEPEAVWPATLTEIDARLRALGRELAGRDMEMATLGLLSVAAFEMFARVEGIAPRSTLPPDREMMTEVHDLERSVMASLTDGGRMSGGRESAEGDEAMPELPTTGLRLSLSEDTGRFWRALEAVHARLVRGSESFVAFLARAVARSWSGVMSNDVAYREIYLRDRWRCASPVCSRRNVTPHHVKFRSQGGSDRADNVVALCEICHLELVHEGRLRVTGVAPEGLRWSALGWAA